MKRLKIYEMIIGFITKNKNNKKSTKVKIIKPKIIKAPKGKKYLSEFIHKLPPNTGYTGDDVPRFPVMLCH